jgi:hypothetical protein
MLGLSRMDLGLQSKVTGPHDWGSQKALEDSSWAWQNHLAGVWLRAGLYRGGEARKGTRNQTAMMAWQRGTEQGV